MSTSRKIRGDSVLGALPEDRQVEIAEHAGTHKITETVEWLRKDGIRTSRSALSRWLSSWSLQQQFKLADADTVDFIALLQQTRPELSEPELQRWADQFFQLRAVKQGDAETYLAFASARTKAEIEKAKLKLKREQVTLDRQRFEMQFCDALRSALADANLKTLLERKAGNAEIIAHLRQTYFSDIDALQQSGSVQLPK